jgi:predicted HAD superfamily phosphohydrolase YqeG
LPASQVAVVGDQVFTDVLGGNLAGAYTVLVRPISQKELGYTRLVRRLERLILKVMG